MIIEPLGYTSMLPNGASGDLHDFNKSTLVLLTNCSQNSGLPNNNNAFVFVVDPNATGEDKLIHKYALGNRNCMIIRKRPTDTLCASVAALASGSGNVSIDNNINVRGTAIAFHDTQHQIDPSTFGYRDVPSGGATSTIAGFSGASEASYHSNTLQIGIAGGPAAKDINKANLVLVTNVTRQKMALLMFDENDVQIGQIMIPRYASVKVRKNPTDKLLGGESIIRVGYNQHFGTYEGVLPGLTYMPIGFTN